jgi:hypothetical protein
MHLSAAYQHQNEFVENLSLAQRERLAFIDFNLQFFGRISRSDLKLDHSTKQFTHRSF